MFGLSIIIIELFYLIFTETKFQQFTDFNEKHQYLRHHWLIEKIVQFQNFLRICCFLFYSYVVTFLQNVLCKNDAIFQSVDATVFISFLRPTTFDQKPSYHIFLKSHEFQKFSALVLFCISSWSGIFDILLLISLKSTIWCWNFFVISIPVLATLLHIYNFFEMKLLIMAAQHILFFFVT